MRVYLVNLEVHGVIFFSSETKHALSSIGTSHLLVAPKAILSPIPLTYALNGFPAELYAWGVDRGPQYALLRGLNKLSYGALPVRVRYQRFFFSMRGMSWGEYRGRLKVNVPRTVTLIGITPPSEFRTAFISEERLPRKLYLRIGSKRGGILLAHLEEAEVRDSYGTLTLPISRGILNSMGCRVKNFTVMLHEFSGEEIGLAEVEGCKVVEACTRRRCERIAIPSR